MVFQIIGSMASMTVVLHTASLLKSSPKDGGFSPIPREEQQTIDCQFGVLKVRIILSLEF
jgi:hypothetical protein